MTIGTFLSSLMVGPLSTKFGRNHGLCFAADLNAIATAIMLGITSVGALDAARLILGKLVHLCSTYLLLTSILKRLDRVFSLSFNSAFKKQPQLIL